MSVESDAVDFEDVEPGGAMSFIGRETELGRLREVWSSLDRAAIQVVVLAGEPRIGKTRVVQEFYRWLNAEQDPGNYWPDTLEAGNNSLHVNPSFDGHEDAGALLPWLWWGLRWTRPDERNPAESLRCAAIADSDHLRPHLLLAQRSADESAAGKKAGWGIAKTAINLATAGVAGSMVELGERTGEWLSLRKERTRGAAAIVDRLAEQQTDELALLKDLLLAVTATDKLAGGAVPLVLVLDDVHWADPESLRFLLDLTRELLRRTKHGGRFPRVMIVATAWEREWNESEEASLPAEAESAPRTLSEMLRVLNQLAHREALDAPTLHVVRVGRIDHGLLPLVRQTLSGLTEAQTALVANRAGGSPGLLVELLLKLSRRTPHLFNDDDPTRPLTEQGEAEVSRMRVSYHELVEERLQCLSRIEAAALRVASHVGLAYPCRFVVELAERALRRAKIDADHAAIENALRRADHPLSIVQSVAPRVSEFRLPAYRDILWRQLQASAQLRDGLDDDATAVIGDWLVEDKMTGLESSERGAFLDFAIGLLRDSVATERGAGNRMTLLLALAEAACDAEAEGRSAVVIQLIDLWQSVYRNPGRSGFRLFGRRRMTGLFLCMKLADSTDIASALAKDGLTALRETENVPEDAPLLLVCLRYAGDIALNSERFAEALDHFQAFSRIASEAYQVQGEDPARLRDVFVSKNRVAEVLLQQGDVEKALKVFNEALVFSQQILNDYGPNAERLRDIHLSKHRIGDALRQQGQIERALPTLREALDDSQSVLDVYGASAQRLRDVFISQAGLGDALVKEGQVGLALTLFIESGAISERILDEYGPSAQRLRDAGLIKGRVGSVLLLQGQVEQARMSFVEALAVSLRVLDEYGPSASRLRDVYFWTSRIGNVFSQQDKIELALEQYRESLAFAKRIVGEYGASASRLRDLRHSETRVALMLRLQGENELADTLLRESLAIDQRVRN